MPVQGEGGTKKPDSSNPNVNPTVDSNIKPSSPSKPEETNLAKPVPDSKTFVEIPKVAKDYPTRGNEDYLFLAKSGSKPPLSTVLHDKAVSLQNSKLASWDFYNQVYTIITNIQDTLLSKRIPVAKVSLKRRDYEINPMLNAILQVYDKILKAYNDSLNTPNFKQEQQKFEEELRAKIKILCDYDLSVFRRDHPDNARMEREEEELQKQEIKKREERASADLKREQEEEDLERKKAEEERQHRAALIAKFQVNYKKMLERPFLPSLEDYADPNKRANIFWMSLDNAKRTVNEVALQENKPVPDTLIGQIQLLMVPIGGRVGKEYAGSAPDFDNTAKLNEAENYLLNDLLPSIVTLIGQDPKLFTDKQVQEALKIVEHGIKDSFQSAVEKHTIHRLRWSDRDQIIGGIGKLSAAIKNMEIRLNNEKELLFRKKEVDGRTGINVGKKPAGSGDSSPLNPANGSPPSKPEPPTT